MFLSRRLLGAVLLGALMMLSSSCVVIDGTSAPRAEGTPSATAPTIPADEVPAAEQDMAQAIFDRVDAERAARGLPALRWDDDLAAVAREWNAEMAERGTLEHQDIGALLGRAPIADLQGLGENIFRATGPVPAGTIHAGWMRSDEHRVNVLNPGWDRVGIAVRCADDGSVWATQEFGRSSGVDLPPVSSTTPPAEPVVRPAEDGPRCS